MQVERRIRDGECFQSRKKTNWTMTKEREEGLGEEEGVDR